MIPASAALHQAIVEGRIHHPDDAKLNAHVAAAVANTAAEAGGSIRPSGARTSTR